MTDKNELIRAAMNRRLSVLEASPVRRARILAAAQEQRGSLHIPRAAVLILALMIFTTAALAASLMFSPRYDAVRLANRALAEEYGITEDLLSALHRSDAVENADGSYTVTYTSSNPAWEAQLGVYTVTVIDGKATALWSHDGSVITGDLTDAAWGCAQLKRICSPEYSTIYHLTAPSVAPLPTPDPDAMLAAMRAARQKAAQAQSLAKISLSDARTLAQEALYTAYAFTDTQKALLESVEDEELCIYTMQEDQPVVELYFWLHQDPDVYFTPMDGGYWVTVNLITGVIEDILYDSTLAGNG